MNAITAPVPHAYMKLSFEMEKIAAVVSGSAGVLVAVYKAVRLIRPKIKAWQLRRAARIKALESLLPRLDALAEAQARIELQVAMNNTTAAIAGHMALTLAGIAAWKSDAAGACTFVTPKLAELLGLDSSAALGNGWLSATHRQDRASVGEEYRAAVQQGRLFDAYYRYKHADGQIVYIHGTAYPAVNPQTGEVKEYWGRAVELTREEYIAATKS